MINNTYHIWYRGDGVIIAIGQPVTQKDMNISGEPVPEQGHDILKAEVSQDLLATLHETHRVELATKTLVSLTPKTYSDA